MKKLFALLFTFISLSAFSQIKISALPNANSLNGTEFFETVQGGSSKKVNANLMRTYFQGNLLAKQNKILTGYISTTDTSNITSSDSIAYSLAKLQAKIFRKTSITDHNLLSNLQGGTTGQYNHLTNTQVTKLNGLIPYTAGTGLSLSSGAFSLNPNSSSAVTLGSTSSTSIQGGLGGSASPSSMTALGGEVILNAVSTYIDVSTGGIALESPSLSGGVTGWTGMYFGNPNTENSFFAPSASAYDITVGSDNSNFGGLKYAANYATKYTARSLVDKSYVDARVSAGGAAWGSITGTLSSQTDLNTKLNTFVDLTTTQTISGYKSFTNGIIIGSGTTNAQLKFAGSYGTDVINGTSIGRTFNLDANAGGTLATQEWVNAFFLPAQAGNSGKVLGTNGTSLSWVTGGGGTTYNNISKTSSYTAVILDKYIECNGTFTITLPTAVGNTNIEINVKNTGTGNITVVCTGSQTIDGSVNKILSVQNQIQKYISNGTNWKIY